jgi:hypothetical protein
MRLRHLVAGVEAGQFLRERFAQRQRFGAFREHEVGHLPPHHRQVALARGLRVAGQSGHAPGRLREVMSQGADARRDGWFVGQPDVDPRAVGAAPERPELPRVLAGALGDQAEAVDRGLDRHHLALLARIPPLDGVDLPREGIEAGPLALMQEERQLVRGRALRDGAGNERDLVLGKRQAGLCRLAGDKCHRHRGAPFGR